MELSKDEINALNWVANGEKAKCKEDEDKVINAFKALDKIGNDDEIVSVGTNAPVIMESNTKLYEIPFPRPVVRDKDGKLVRNYSLRDWYLKLQEEIFEVSEAIMADVHAEITAEELADLITVCISYLEYLGFDEKARRELFAKVNAKNEKRGYFRNT